MMIPVWKIDRGCPGWTPCLTDGYIAIGWDLLGNLLHYPDKGAIQTALPKYYPPEPGAPPISRTNDTHTLWSFSREVQVGDIVIANQGMNEVLGIGVVTSSYIPPSSPKNPRRGLDCLNVRLVDWFATFNPPHQLPSGCKQFHRKTVNRTGLRIDDEGNVQGPVENKPQLESALAASGLTVADVLEASKAAITKNRIASRYDRALSTNNNLILQGPPGTSKTHEARQLAAHILGLHPDAGDMHKSPPHVDRPIFQACRLNGAGSSGYGRWEIVQLHPAYHYEDFVRGIRVSTPAPGGPTAYTTENGIFAKMCDAAVKDPDHKYVLIIDEINRAPLAGVFGELIYGLEYRGDEVSTPYAIGGSSSLKVPDNLYVIGTMNTADRSIGHIDYAIRRRFAFIPLLPDRNIIVQYYKCDPLRDAALRLYDSVAHLFNTRPQGHLSPDFHRDDVQPGHTYFLAVSCDQLFAKFVYQTMPLLREYVKDGVLDSSASLRIGARGYPLNGSLSHEDALNRLATDAPCDDCADNDDEGNHEEDMIPNEGQREA